MHGKGRRRILLLEHIFHAKWREREREREKLRLACGE